MSRLPASGTPQVSRAAQSRLGNGSQVHNLILLEEHSTVTGKRRRPPPVQPKGLQSLRGHGLHNSAAHALNNAPVASA